MIKGILASAAELAALVSWLTLATTVVLCQPSYVSQHFEVYDYAGVGLSYLQAVANAMDRAMESILSHGASLARPCGGSRYVVNVLRLPGEELGFTKSQFTVDGAGRIVGACVVWVNITTGLHETKLRAAAHHELVHVAQASYYRHASVAQARPWYVEASAEGFGSALSGVCIWAPYYFSYGLYKYNPYRFSGAEPRCYALGAFYYWILSSGYSSVDSALRGSLSGESVVSNWVNSAYLDYLLALAKGITLCGTRYVPEFIRVYLPAGAWSTTLTIDGLSAAYFRIELPAPGPVLVTASGDLRSNIALGQPFIAQNTSLLIALANPRLEPITVSVEIQYRPLLEVKVVRGLYDGWSKSLELILYVLHAGQPVTGVIDVGGVTAEAINGYARIVLREVTWGKLTLKVSYSGSESYVQVNLARPSASLVTASTLYLTPCGRGEIKLVLRNPGDVGVRARLTLEAPPFIQAEPTVVDAPRGEASLGLPFSVNSTPYPAAMQLRVCYSPSDCTPLQLSVTPVELRVLQARYDSADNATSVEALAEPVNLRLTATVRGFSGTAWFKHSTYYVGCLNVTIPPPTVKLAASPLLVAPSWLLLSVNATVSAADARPAFKVSYAVHVVVNGVLIGSVDFNYGDARTLSSVVNLTYAGASLTLEGPFIEPVLLRVPKPALEVVNVDWLIDDDGSTVRVEVSVSGPCRFLVLGREAANETLALEKRLEREVSVLKLDLGFETLHFETPEVQLELTLPPVALAGLPVDATLILRTAARVNATVAVLMEGWEVERLHLTKLGSEIARASVTLMPPSPGVYRVAVRAWFANASASFLYVKVLGFAVEAPRFALLGSRAPIRAVLSLEPPVVPRVNVTVKGCGPELELMLEANSTALLSFNGACKAVVVARFLNYTASAVTYWDTLTLTFESVLGYLDGGLIVPSGTLKPVALFANATPAPARVLVDGQPTLTLLKPGSYTVKLEAELWGVRNETTTTVYAVPEELYASATELARELGEPSHLVRAMRFAVISGRWEKVKSFTDTYGSARRSPEPMVILAAALAEKWAREGNETYLNAAQALLALRPAAYLALIVAAGVIVAGRARRKPREASRLQGGEEKQPSG